MSLYAQHISMLSTFYGLLLFVATIVYIQVQYKAAVRPPQEGRARLDFSLPIFIGLIGLSGILFSLVVVHTK